ncbi:hypothetical protein [Polymorphospora rubra]|uniref:hypothetical protein n=1 Tax=Polymorphospora rubra TaxID=338584 RepID=UPI001BB32EDB|nr:hypothetical protein [Polymorphospora rubra]
MIYLSGVQYAETAREACQNWPDVTPDRVRDWVRRSAKVGDPLYGVITPHRYRGRTYLPVHQVAAAEKATRMTRHAGGRRRVDILAAIA